MEVLIDTGVAKDHLEFAARMLEMVTGDVRREDWDRRIRQARDRLTDTRFYLAITGEFNAGKSTFINALLESELFASSWLPTTAAAVRIGHGELLRVDIGFRDGKHWTAASSELAPGQRRLGKPAGQQFTGLTPAQIRARLSKMGILEALQAVTTDDDAATLITSVEVTYPSPLLATGLVLIDTPGSESGENAGHGHAEIARREVTTADLAVVITRQDHVLPQTLADFLNAALDPGLLARCAFVVTSADQSDPEEFLDLCRAATERIAGKLNLTDPPVVWAAPLQVVRAARGDELTSAELIWAERFDRTRKWLRRVAAARRPAAVADTALRIVKELLDELDVELAAAIAALEHQQLELAAVLPADMGDFLAAQVDKGIEDLNDAEHSVVSKIRDMTWESRDDVERAIRNKIEECTTNSELKQVVNDELSSIVNDELGYLSRTGARTARELLNEQLHDVSGELHDAFAAEFARLERIDAAPAAAASGGLGVASDSIGSSAFSSASEYVAADMQRDAMSVGGGAVGGAILGSMVFPVIGTAVGALLGAFFGSLRTRPMSAIREETIALATPKALGYVEDTGDQLEEYAEETAREARSDLRRQAGWYRSRYEAAVQAMTDDIQARQRALKDRHTLLSNLRAEAASRRTSVMGNRIQLRTVDRIDISDPFGGSGD